MNVLNGGQLAMRLHDWAARRSSIVWTCLLFALVISVVPSAGVSAQQGANSKEVEAARALAVQYAHDKAIAVAELEIIAAGNSRLENWIGIFGILNTIILAVGGIATYQLSAAAAAKAAKEEISSLRNEFEIIKKAVEADAAEIAAVAIKAREDAATKTAGAETVDKIELQIPDSGTSPTSVSADDQSLITAAAKIIDEKPQDQWDVDDYKAKISQIRYVQRDWNQTIKLADSILLKYPKDLDALCFANNRKGDALRELGKYAEALTCYDVAIQSYNLVPNPNSLPSYVSALHGKGSCLIYTEQPIKAVKLYQALLPIRIAADGPDSVGTLVTRHMMARSRLASGKLKEAISDFKKVLIDRRRIEGQNSKGAVLTGCWLAQALLQAKDVNQANETFEGIGDAPTADDWSPRYLALYAFTQGQVFDAQGLSDKATMSLDRAGQYYIQTPPENSYYRARFNEYITGRQKSAEH
jgi:tetratricopeptide (TPR) repeat protein